MRIGLTLFAAAAATATMGINGWFPVEATVNPADAIQIRFTLKPADAGALPKALQEVSDPTSGKYRQYLTNDQVAAVVAPAAGAVEAVKSWVTAQLPGATVALSTHGDNVLVEAQAQAVSAHFGELQVFEHVETGKRVVRRADQGRAKTAVPAELEQYVGAVFGVSELFPVPRRSAMGNYTSDPGDTVSPPVIFKQYGMGDDAVGGRTATSQGVAAFEQAEFRPSDVAAFEQAFDLPAIKFGVVGPNDGGYFGEAGLDTQYIVASGRKVPSWFLSQDAFDMSSFCELVLKMEKPPSVVSISWGSGESNYNQDHMQTATTCFQKMGAQGITVLAASGDQGTGKQGLFTCGKFDPTWPASCPYVTAVGGTYVSGGTENGWNGSGGGFSAIFKRESYQEKIVDAYTTAAKLPDSKYFDQTGRATPDVSALATNFQVYSGGVATGTLTGTSAATPTFAGMISVINDMLVAKGKPTVGFINPTLYAAAGADKSFLGFDVTTGNNKAGGCPAGFDAAEGWDPVTGLGTPTFEKLKAIFGVAEDAVVV